MKKFCHVKFCVVWCQSVQLSDIIKSLLSRSCFLLEYISEEVENVSTVSSVAEVELSSNPSVASVAETDKGSMSTESLESSPDLAQTKVSKRNTPTPLAAMPILEELTEA